MTEHAATTDPAVTVEPRHEYEATREVRFGVVLYGGVSLAIYMNGVVQELYRLVRATAPASDGKALRWPNDRLRGSESVYRELGQRLIDGQLGAPADGEPGPVRTRFVVDLLTGASAGGINGVFLAKALARDHALDSLEQLWVDKGDISKLLNDRPSDAELKGRGVSAADKSSLLNSKWMYLQLLSAIKNLNPDVRKDVGVNASVQPSPYADALDLWVSTTDLEGRIDTVNTSDAPNGAIKERSNRTLLHFAYASDNAAGYSPRDDFRAENDPLLAFAARATSSFPAAFEPARLGDIQEAASALDAGASWQQQLEGFFPRYAIGEAEAHSFADGGYLDNKPFEQIMRTLPLRRSSLPVSRQILYVEPDPGSPPQIVLDPKLRRPDIIATILAVLSTPRNETIADDVADIRQFGARGKARQAAYDSLTQALEDQLRAPVEPDQTDDRAEPASSDTDLQHRAQQFVAESPTAHAYRAARDMSVRADIAALLARVLPKQPRDEGTPLHAAFIGFVDHIAATQPLLQNDQPRTCFDVLFHLRRLNFLQHSASLSGADPGDVCELRQRLDTVFGTIRAAARSVRQPRSVGARPDEYATKVGSVVDAFGGEGVDFGTESSPIKAELVTAYDKSTELQKAIASLLKDACDRLALAAHEGETLAAIKAHPSLGNDLLPRMYFYELYDQISVSFDDLPGENSDIPVTRISPLDATELVTDSGKRLDKLAGSALSHFGGFFDENWRRNDILWGRLDAAERIIDALVPPDMAVDRSDLIKRAQIEILREAWADPATRLHVLAPIVENIAAPRPKPKSEKKAKRGGDGPSDRPAPEISMEQLRAQMAQTPRAKGGPTTQEWSDLSARALRVVNNVGTYVSVGSLDKQPVVTVAARLAKLLANVLDFVTGRGLKSTVLRNALVLLAIVGLTIGVIGVVHGPSSLTRTGFTLLATMLIVRAVADTVVDRLAGTRTRLRALTRVIFLALTAAAVGGLIVLHHRYPEWKPLLFTALPALVVLLVNLVSNKRIAPWMAALLAVFGAMVYLSYVVVTNPTELWHVIHK
jgi:patatin-related protein